MTTLERILGTRQFTGWHMLGVLFLFFGTIIAVNLTLAYYANSSWTGLVVQNSYVESQRFNTVTQERLRQAELGWNSDVAYDGTTFSLALTDKSGMALEDCVVTARIGHPASSADDRMLQMEFRDGSYAAETELTPGIWAADVNVTGPRGEVWTREIRFIVKG